jgi:hypothetical protein
VSHGCFAFVVRVKCRSVSKKSRGERGEGCAFFLVKNLSFVDVIVRARMRSERRAFKINVYEGPRL